MRMKIVMLALVCAGLLTQHAFASEADAVKRMKQARDYLEDMMAAPEEAIPQGLLERSRAVIIMRQYKAGFGISVKGGGGVILARRGADGPFGAPAFIKTAEGGIGFQIGGQSIDAIFLVLNKEGVDMILKTSFKIGADASFAAGPVGRDAKAELGLGTAIVGYSRTKGAFVGAAFEGGVFIRDEAANQAIYGRNMDSEDILFGDTPIPEAAWPLVKALNHYAGVKTTAPAPAPKVRRVPPATAPAKKPADEPDAVEKMRELKRLFDEGLISKEEYDKRRQAVLDKHFD